MSIKSALVSLLDEMDDAHAVLLLGYDCVTIDEARRGNAGFDAELLAVTCGTMLRELKSSVPQPGVGDLEELSLVTGNACLLIRILSEDYFVALVLPKGGNYGRARFLLRSRALSLIEEVG